MKVSKLLTIVCVIVFAFSLSVPVFARNVDETGYKYGDSVPVNARLAEFSSDVSLDSTSVFVNVALSSESTDVSEVVESTSDIIFEAIGDEIDFDSLNKDGFKYAENDISVEQNLMAKSAVQDEIKIFNPNPDTSRAKASYVQSPVYGYTAYHTAHSFYMEYSYEYNPSNGYIASVFVHYVRVSPNSNMNYAYSYYSSYNVAWKTTGDAFHFRTTVEYVPYNSNSYVTSIIYSPDFSSGL